MCHKVGEEGSAPWVGTVAAGQVLRHLLGDKDGRQKTIRRLLMLSVPLTSSDAENKL